MGKVLKNPVKSTGLKNCGAIVESVDNVDYYIKKSRKR